jgi:hypothetical protein
MQVRDPLGDLSLGGLEFPTRHGFGYSPIFRLGGMEEENCSSAKIPFEKLDLRTESLCLEDYLPGQHRQTLDRKRALTE